MGFLQLAEVQPCVAKPHIGEVVFDRGVDILFSLDIITHRAVNQECITQILDISGNGCFADRLLFDAFESS